MSDSAYHIPLLNLCLSFLPTGIVIALHIRWSLSALSVGYALLRMTVQLILVGFALNFIFLQDHPLFVGGVLAFMLLASAWIALRPLRQLRRNYFAKTFAALSAGGVPVLFFITVFVIHLEPWYMPRYLIPLAGMIFANSMNSVSLCAERFEAEREKGQPFPQARNTAYQAALLPLMNSLFAVGLVSLPGMMTGQILSGESPLLAVRYQIVVMSMLLGAAGISSAVYLILMERAPRGA